MCIQIIPLIHCKLYSGCLCNKAFEYPTEKKIMQKFLTTIFLYTTTLYYIFSFIVFIILRIFFFPTETRDTLGELTIIKLKD